MRWLSGIASAKIRDAVWIVPLLATAGSLAVLDLIPPPFPFTLFVLAAGALDVSGPTFFTTLFVCRLLRFGVEARLATRYGSSLVRVFESDTFHDVVFGMIVLAVILTVLSLVKLFRSAGRTRRRAAV